VQVEEIPEERERVPALLVKIVVVLHLELGKSLSER
jgi:hypothetical protein